MSQQKLPRSKLANANRLLRATVFIPLALSLSLGACSSLRNETVDTTVTGAIDATALTGAELDAAAAYWGERYANDPDDAGIAVNYAAVLGRLGRHQQAVAVLQRATLNYPEDRTIMAAYGKALASVGSFNEALTIIRRAQRPDQPDWQLLSVEGTILDQLGQPNAARSLYQAAIDLAPQQAVPWSNLAMSHILTGQLTEAEEILRHAVTLPTADSRVWENLVLAIGLQGRFSEAEQIARRELPAAQAEASIAYVRSLIAGQDTWAQLAAGEGS